MSSQLLNACRDHNHDIIIQCSKSEPIQVVFDEYKNNSPLVVSLRTRKHRNKNYDTCNLLLSLGSRPTPWDLVFLMGEFMDDLEDIDLNDIIFLLIHGADPNGRFRMKVAMEMDSDVYIDLYELHEDIESWNIPNFSEDNVALSYYLIESRLLTEQWFDEEETTPLCQALWHGCDEIISLYIQYGGRMNDPYVFRYACISPHFYGTLYMDQCMNAGVNPREVVHGRSAVDFMCLELEELDMLCKYQWFISHGISLTERTKDGGSILHNLVMYPNRRKGHLAAFTFLLSQPFMIDVLPWKDKNGHTIIDKARITGCSKDIILLLTKFISNT